MLNVYFENKPNDFPGIIIVQSIITAFSSLTEIDNEQFKRGDISSVNCSEINLASLKGLPQTEFDLQCQSNKLTTLEGCPPIVNSFNCSRNPLTSLRGAPIEVLGVANFAETQITSFEFLPTKMHSDCYLHSNIIASLQGIHKHFKNGFLKGRLIISPNITSHLLGALLIDELREIGVMMSSGVGEDETSLVKAVKIINKHLLNELADRDLVDCQQQLIDAGLKVYAQL